MITFNYLINDFIDNAQLQSMYRAGTMYNSGQEGVLLDPSISAEDDGLLKKYLKVGVTLIAQVISGYTKDLRNSKGDILSMVGEPMEFDITYETVENSIVFRVNMPETFNLAVIKALDEAIKDTMENYILYRTGRSKGTEFESFQQDWETALGRVRAYINRRTETIRRSYSFI